MGCFPAGVSLLSSPLQREKPSPLDRPFFDPSEFQYNQQAQGFFPKSFVGKDQGLVLFDVPHCVFSPHV